MKYSRAMPMHQKCRLLLSGTRQICERLTRVFVHFLPSVPNRQQHFLVPGFSLVEAIVTVSISSIVMIAIVGSILFFYRANTSSIEQSFQLTDARRGVEFMVRDLREATFGDDGSYPLLSIASTSITFFSDTDKDTSIERITYALATTTLTRTVVDSSGTPLSYTGSGATSIVSTYVRNEEESAAIFRYYDANGAEITDYGEIDQVRFVSVSLIVNVQPVRAPEEFTLRSSATLRNLRN